MSSQAVEARSLSSLTTLASNPPAYPRNPTHVRHEPLVLYIARVPGSRDVFLSPMKPREKVVTAEDIQSSLYFIHVNQPEDVRLVTPPLEAQQFTPPYPSSPTSQSAPSIPRKAVPNVDPPKRKPLPGTLAPINNFENRQNINASNFTQGPPGMLGPDYHPRVSFDNHIEEESKPPLPLRKPSDPSTFGTTLTVIRRDPASNAQWNVACIEDPQVFDVSSSTMTDTSPKKKFGSPVYIDVTNPGYSKFLNTPDRPELLKRSSNLSMQSQMSAFTSGLATPVIPLNVPFAPSLASDAPGETEQEETVFRRRLWMEVSKTPNGGYGHRHSSSHDSTLGRKDMRGSWEGLKPEPIPSPSPASLTVEKQSNFRGYVFMSPWNGRCEFITGAAGASLKCRHVIPGLQGGTPMAVSVSELRFNLPSSTSKSSGTGGDESSKRSSFFHRPRHGRNNSAVSEMDLSLGQEFAGGGFGGKHAKLGKLIIEDEGLKMLDLLVAANMALWWRAYEKVDGRPKSRDL